MAIGESVGAGVAVGEIFGNGVAIGESVGCGVGVCGATVAGTSRIGVGRGSAGDGIVALGGGVSARRRRGPGWIGRTGSINGAYDRERGDFVGLTLGEDGAVGVCVGSGDGVAGVVVGATETVALGEGEVASVGDADGVGLTVIVGEADGVADGVGVGVGVVFVFTDTDGLCFLRGFRGGP